MGESSATGGQPGTAGQGSTGTGAGTGPGVTPEDDGIKYEGKPNIKYEGKPNIKYEGDQNPETTTSGE